MPTSLPGVVVGAAEHAERVLIMEGTSIAALLYTHGDVSSQLVVMYSINVFLTFSFPSEFSMFDSGSSTRNAWTGTSTCPCTSPGSRCASILIVTCFEIRGGRLAPLVITGV